MKKILVVLLAVLALATSRTQAVPLLVTLAWDPIPPAQVTPDLSVRIYTSTDLVTPKIAWPFLVETPATNNSVSLFIEPGEHFFVATTRSSFWDIESSFSEVALTPPAPSDLFTLTIRLGP